MLSLKKNMQYLTQYSMVNQVMKMASAMAKSRCSLVSLVSGSVTLKFSLCSLFYAFSSISGLNMNFNSYLKGRDCAKNKGKGGHNDETDGDDSNHLR